MFVHEVDGSPLPTGGAGGRCAGGVAEGRGADGCRRGGGRNPKQFGFSPSAKNVIPFYPNINGYQSYRPVSSARERHENARRSTETEIIILFSL